MRLAKASFNRTNVELKLIQKADSFVKSSLLIELM